jgi:hypothetical protein
MSGLPNPEPPIECDSNDPNIPGVTGKNTAGTGTGVYGYSGTAQGQPGGPVGVHGESQTFDGVSGICHANGFSGVSGFNKSPNGGPGLYGYCGPAGTQGQPGGPVGVHGESQTFDGVSGICHANGFSGVSGFNDSPNGGPGVFGKGNPAGRFFGNVEVTGDLTFVAAQSGGGDCAEEFDLGTAVESEPGTVMVLDDNGALQPSHTEYDRKVAGVISGAGDYRPGLVLGKCDSSQKRIPLALMGKVYCKVDAQYAPVEIGDLLTTSPTLGHAMKAVDASLAFGAVIGKALRPLGTGQGLIPILVALQ